MTKLSSEQYRDVLRRAELAAEIPNVQHLLRKGVVTFFERFGGYPEIAGVAPGKIGILGDQTQFNDGLAFTMATPLTTIVLGRRVPRDNYIIISTADVGKPHKVTFSTLKKRPPYTGCPEWVNIVKGVMAHYPDKSIPGFEAVIASSVPLGVGLGSTSAMEVAIYTFLEILINTKVEPIEKALTCQKVEEEFLGKQCGVVERMTSVMAEDRHGMLIDTKNHEVEYIPFTNRDVVFIAIDSHLKDTLLGYEYPERTEYITKACEILGIDSLRHCTDENLEELERKIGEINQNFDEGMTDDYWDVEKYTNVLKYAKFFVNEMKRVEEALTAWRDEDFQTFGSKLVESHNSLKEDFGFDNPLLNFFVETSLEVDGVLGSRMEGMGLTFGGSVITLLEKSKLNEYFNYVTVKYMEYEGIATELLKKKFQQELEAEKVRQKTLTESTISSQVKSSEATASQATGSQATALDDTPQVAEIDAPECKIKETKPKVEESEEKIQEVDSASNTCLDDPRMIAKMRNRGCESWAKAEKERKKLECLRKYKECLKKIEEDLGDEERRKSSAKEEEKERESEEEEEEEEEMEGEEGPEFLGEAESVNVVLKPPTFYILSPFPGARMMFVTKTDLLRTRYAIPVPHPKDLVQKALDVYKETYKSTPEVAGLAPGCVGLFGEFLEYYLGISLKIALPMMIVTMGGRNDSVYFSVKTTSTEVGEPTITKSPIPCVGKLKLQPQSWVNYVNSAVALFKGHVPGFDAVIHSSLPCELGLHSCSALQASFFTFLEGLTRTCTGDAFEKANICERSEYYFLSSPEVLLDRCSSVKYLPTFLCKEGHVISLDGKRHEVKHHFLDHPSYVFLIAACRQNTSQLNIDSLHERLLICQEASDILQKPNLTEIEEKHLMCLEKRGASEEMIKRATYIMKEHKLTLRAMEAMDNGDYATLGALMTESHYSLRDDFEVSSPEIEQLISLALNEEGVLGAKMLGKGLNAAIIILAKLDDVDRCIKHMKEKFQPKINRPLFFVTKPSKGAYTMDMKVEFPHILDYDQVSAYLGTAYCKF